MADKNKTNVDELTKVIKRQAKRTLACSLSPVNILLLNTFGLDALFSDKNNFTELFLTIMSYRSNRTLLLVVASRRLCRLLARRASRRPGTPLEQNMDAQILGKKGNYFQLFP